MDALILSCGTGGGHDSAGKAVKEELIRRGHAAEMMNPYSLRSERLANRVNQTYIKLVQKAPVLFGFIYRLGSLYRRLPVKSPVYYCNGAMTEVMEQYLSEHHYDVVFMPHLFPADILTNMKNHGIEVPRMIFLATDYACIPFTEETDCDAYVVPTKELESDYIKYGIPEEKLHALGIPVGRAFSEPMEREEAISQLGLDPERKYVLIAGGSMGAGKIEQVIHIVAEYCKEDPQMQMIVLCGTHSRLYKKLNKKYGDQVLVLEHTDQMPLYLKACSLYITKPGGLSSTEAAVSGISLVHTIPIPGCEMRNMHYFAKHGMSISLNISYRYAKSKLIEMLKKLQKEDIRARMIQNQREQINSHAASDICDLAERIVGNAELAEREVEADGDRESTGGLTGSEGIY